MKGTTGNFQKKEKVLIRGNPCSLVVTMEKEYPYCIPRDLNVGTMASPRDRNSPGSFSPQSTLGLMFSNTNLVEVVAAVLKEVQLEVNLTVESELVLLTLFSAHRRVLNKSATRGAVFCLFED